jgi:hypothetical protein
MALVSNIVKKTGNRSFPQRFAHDDVHPKIRLILAHTPSDLYVVYNQTVYPFLDYSCRKSKLFNYLHIID